MKKPYCCDESREFYQRYYDRQQKNKGDFPVYVGRYTQRGHGVGNVLGSLVRRILPILKAVAPHVLRTGANLVQDVVSGKSWKQAAIKRVPEVLRNVRVNDETPAALSTTANVFELFTDKGQTGSGKRKRTRQRTKKGKRIKTDVFD